MKDSVPRSLAARWFLCGDLIVVIATFLVVGGGGAAVLQLRGDSAAAVSVGTGVVLYGVIALAVWALLRRVPRAQDRVHGHSGTGFAEVEEVRRRMRQGETLDPAQQEVADDLARVVQARGRLGRSLRVVAALLLLVVGGSILLGLQFGHTSQVVDGVVVLATAASVAVAERRRTAAVRVDLLATSRGS